MKESKKHWKGIEEREQTTAYLETLESEFPEPPPRLDVEPGAEFPEAAVSRRSFLTAAGFSIAGSTLAGCSRGPLEKVIPLLNRPEEMIPGRAYWYSSTCRGCTAGCGIVTKNRDGRPIKIEGNPEHPLSRGGLCAVGQAMVLSLYDSQRLQDPMINGQPGNWADLDLAVTEGLEALSDGVFVLTGTVSSPSERARINQFLARFEGSEHIEYDPVSCSAILDAHQQTHGQRRLPHYRFDRARVIVSFDADFLGTWISPVEFTKGYSSGRTLEGESPQLSHHLQLEGRMSLTGSNADQRIKVSPDDLFAWLAALTRRLADRSGVDAPLAGPAAVEVDQDLLDQMVERLLDARGASLVVSGVNDFQNQLLVNFINHLLGNYGTTLDLDQPSFQANGNDRRIFELLGRMQAGEVKALLIAGVNPAYSLPYADQFTQALESIPITVAFAEQFDETARVVRYVCPLHHALEAWGEQELTSGVISLSQPVLAPLGRTRSLCQCLSSWMGNEPSDLERLRSHFREEVFPRQSKIGDFEEFWNQSVHDGYARVQPRSLAAAAFQLDALEPAAAATLDENSYALVLYEKISMRDGRHAHNPWLQELPDPVTKVVWDNYACIAPAVASRLKLQEGDRVRVTAGNTSLEFPVQIQPGQHEKVIAIALGYGRQGTDRFSKVGARWIQGKATVLEGETIGGNAFLYTARQGPNITFVNAVSLEPTGQRSPLALTQTHHTVTVPEKLGGAQRHMVRDTTLTAYREDPASGNHFEHEVLQLWDQDYVYTGHHWGMAIDLNRCTGCSACVVGCQAENNVPVVGKDEVYRRRDMHWIRIDRYYSGDDQDVETVHQPMMCNHCDHAPCEAVCPVLATVHNDEGINQQIYNRCVGTRYCANNCPYKVRRFNWFDYRTEDVRENLVLNPDITTRTRGVMEKCSLCIQRIQEAKYEAKREGREMVDGDIKIACQQSCPADAIVFGDMNDPESRITQAIDNPRHYRVLEEMNFRPSIGYLTKVRNKEDAGEGHG
ncbi:MAG: TAT-variant-translocated molybdopterin oxidoreductase [Acidobacteriota bacterium]